ncbi:MurR/RpiR family transcriptional regulator [Peribacillus alkalitolerans]|uniref:MurR/RpiR family transcriptional regulator n=1 Tax=Peribacillus alkalitolerans TaxID=1550385 RepID=UPI0013D109B1|nr:MurR/RpiR family transcriptional regulator [Peribacillus alkalitolerans]
MYVVNLIESNLKDFSPAESNVAKYVLSHPERVIDMSTKHLADACEVSEAAIIRFCKRIGINSFKGLKIEIAKELNPSFDGIIQNSSFLPDDSLIQVMDKVRDRSVSALMNTMKILQVDMLEKASEAIHLAKKVFLYGAGGSSIVAMDASYKLLRINIPTFISLDIHVQMMMVANMEPGDVLLVVSTSGKTKEIIDLLAEAKDKGCVTILLTQHGKSPAQKLADIILATSDEEQNVRIGTMSARIAQLAVIDALFIAVCMKKGPKVYERIIDTHNAVQKRKKS